MSKVFQIAKREFVATVFTKAFIIGLMMVPALMLAGVLIGPWLFGEDTIPVHGQVALIDPTGKLAPEWRAPLGGGFTLTLVERPADSNLEEEKRWLRVADIALPHLALVVIHDDAIEPRSGEKTLGSYDLLVPPNQDMRTEWAIQQGLRQAIVSARVRAHGLDGAQIHDLVTVADVDPVTVSERGEHENGAALTFVLPVAFMSLLLMAVMGSGQGLLTTTIEEKSSRVIEVLLSAVSPMQLMAGKLLGHMAISLIGISVYIGLGILTLRSFALIGLLAPSLLLYLLIFFLLAFFTIGSLMMAMGAAVNDMREAQSLMTPMMIFMTLPWFLWSPISRDPNSTLSLVVSFLPPLSSFGMLLRIASGSPPPAWQIWLSIGIGAVGVVGVVWAASKIFRIGLLMFGKPPNFATLVRWVREA